MTPESTDPGAAAQWNPSALGDRDILDELEIAIRGEWWDRTSELRAELAFRLRQTRQVATIAPTEPRAAGLSAREVIAQWDYEGSEYEDSAHWDDADEGVKHWYRDRAEELLHLIAPTDPGRVVIELSDAREIAGMIRYTMTSYKRQGVRARLADAIAAAERAASGGT